MKFYILILVLLLSSCADFGRPEKTGKGWYLVKPTDTLYSIAWRYNIDFKTLASWNQIKEPYLIKPGQYIRLIKTRDHVNNKVHITKNNNYSVKQPKTIKKYTSMPLKWVWPVQGNPLNRFAINDINKRGIDIASKVRQPVVAVASGKVVYSGNGLAGYKNLIIIKHNETYLSAYAQNKNLLVKEGDLVKQGKKIANMGLNNKNNYVLHFQIRKNGKPIDPLIFLPKK